MNTADNEVDRIVHLGLSLYDSGDFDGALGKYREAASYGQTHGASPNTLGLCYRNIGFTLGEMSRHRDEISAYEDGLKLDVLPDIRAQLLCGKGDALCQMHQYDSGIGALQEGLEFAQNPIVRGMLTQNLEVAYHLKRYGGKAVSQEIRQMHED